MPNGRLHLTFTKCWDIPAGTLTIKYDESGLVHGYALKKTTAGRTEAMESILNGVPPDMSDMTSPPLGYMVGLTG